MDTAVHGQYSSQFNGPPLKSTTSRNTLQRVLHDQQPPATNSTSHEPVDTLLNADADIMMASSPVGTLDQAQSRNSFTLNGTLLDEHLIPEDQLETQFDWAHKGGITPGKRSMVGSLHSDRSLNCAAQDEYILDGPDSSLHNILQDLGPVVTNSAQKQAHRDQNGQEAIQEQSSQIVANGQCCSATQMLRDPRKPLTHLRRNSGSPRRIMSRRTVTMQSSTTTRALKIAPGDDSVPRQSSQAGILTRHITTTEVHHRCYQIYSFIGDEQLVEQEVPRSSAGSSQSANEKLFWPMREYAFEGQGALNNFAQDRALLNYGGAHANTPTSQKSLIIYRPWQSNKLQINKSMTSENQQPGLSHYQSDSVAAMGGRSQEMQEGTFGHQQAQTALKANAANNSKTQFSSAQGTLRSPRQFAHESSATSGQQQMMKSDSSPTLLWSPRRSAAVGQASPRQSMLKHQGQVMGGKHMQHAAPEQQQLPFHQKQQEQRRPMHNVRMQSSKEPQQHQFAAGHGSAGALNAIGQQKQQPKELARMPLQQSFNNQKRHVSKISESTHLQLQQMYNSSGHQGQSSSSFNRRAGGSKMNTSANNSLSPANKSTSAQQQLIKVTRREPMTNTTVQTTTIRKVNESSAGGGNTSQPIAVSHQKQIVTKQQRIMPVSSADIASANNMLMSRKDAGKGTPYLLENSTSRVNHLATCSLVSQTRFSPQQNVPGHFRHVHQNVFRQHQVQLFSGPAHDPTQNSAASTSNGQQPFMIKECVVGRSQICEGPGSSAGYQQQVVHHEQSSHRVKYETSTFSFQHRPSQEDSCRGTPSIAPSFTPSMSVAPSSSNALLSEIIRLDDEDESWLKGQLMMPQSNFLKQERTTTTQKLSIGPVQTTAATTGASTSDASRTGDQSSTPPANDKAQSQQAAPVVQQFKIEAVEEPMEGKADDDPKDDKLMLYDSSDGEDEQVPQVTSVEVVDKAPLEQTNELETVKDVPASKQEDELSERGKDVEMQVDEKKVLESPPKLQENEEHNAATVVIMLDNSDQMEQVLSEKAPDTPQVVVEQVQPDQEQAEATDLKKDHQEVSPEKEPASTTDDGKKASSSSPAMNSRSCDHNTEKKSRTDAPLDEYEDEEDEESSNSDSEINQKDFLEYKRLYQQKLEQAKQLKIAQFRREAAQREAAAAAAKAQSAQNTVNAPKDKKISSEERNDALQTCDDQHQDGAKPNLKKWSSRLQEDDDKSFMEPRVANSNREDISQRASNSQANASVNERCNEDLDCSMKHDEEIEEPVEAMNEKLTTANDEDPYQKLLDIIDASKFPQDLMVSMQRAREDNLNINLQKLLHKWLDRVCASSDLNPRQVKIAKECFLRLMAEETGKQWNDVYAGYRRLFCNEDGQKNDVAADEESESALRTRFEQVTLDEPFEEWLDKFLTANLHKKNIDTEQADGQDDEDAEIVEEDVVTEDYCATIRKFRDSYKMQRLQASSKKKQRNGSQQNQSVKSRQTKRGAEGTGAAASENKKKKKDDAEKREDLRDGNGPAPSGKQSKVKDGHHMGSSRGTGKGKRGEAQDMTPTHKSKRDSRNTLNASSKRQHQQSSNKRGMSRFQQNRCGDLGLLVQENVGISCINVVDYLEDSRTTTQKLFQSMIGESNESKKNLNALAKSLLNFELPHPKLSDDRLLYRQIFRHRRMESDELQKRQQTRSSINCFESFTQVNSESNGPKVLYITAKSQDGKDKDSDVLKDIDGHPIEKILQSKLTEKALQDKWKQEEEELDRVRQAKQQLWKLKFEDKLSDEDLMTKAIEMVKQIMQLTSENSAKQQQQIHHVAYYDPSDAPSADLVSVHGGTVANQKNKKTPGGSGGNANTPSLKQRMGSRDAQQLNKSEGSDLETKKRRDVSERPARKQAGLQAKRRSNSLVRKQSEQSRQHRVNYEVFFNEMAENARQIYEKPMTMENPHGYRSPAAPTPPSNIRNPNPIFRVTVMVKEQSKNMASNGQNSKMRRSSPMDDGSMRLSQAMGIGHMSTSRSVVDGQMIFASPRNGKPIVQINKQGKTASINYIHMQQQQAQGSGMYKIYQKEDQSMMHRASCSATNVSYNAGVTQSIQKKKPQPESQVASAASMARRKDSLEQQRMTKNLPSEKESSGKKMVASSSVGPKGNSKTVTAQQQAMAIGKRSSHHKATLAVKMQAQRNSRSKVGAQSTTNASTSQAKKLTPGPGRKTSGSIVRQTRGPLRRTAVAGAMMIKKGLGIQKKKGPMTRKLRKVSLTGKAGVLGSKNLRDKSADSNINPDGTLRNSIRIMAKKLCQKDSVPQGGNLVNMASKTTTGYQSKNDIKRTRKVNSLMSRKLKEEQAQVEDKSDQAAKDDKKKSTAADQSKGDRQLRKLKDSLQGLKKVNEPGAGAKQGGKKKPPSCSKGQVDAAMKAKGDEMSQTIADSSVCANNEVDGNAAGGVTTRMSLRLRSRNQSNRGTSPQTSNVTKENVKPGKKVGVGARKRTAPFDQIDEKSVRNEDAKSAGMNEVMSACAAGKDRVRRGADKFQRLATIESRVGGTGSKNFNQFIQNQIRATTGARGAKPEDRQQQFIDERGSVGGDLMAYEASITGNEPMANLFDQQQQMPFEPSMNSIQKQDMGGVIQSTNSNNRQKDFQAPQDFGMQQQMRQQQQLTKQQQQFYYMRQTQQQQVGTPATTQYKKKDQQQFQNQNAQYGGMPAGYMSTNQQQQDYRFMQQQHGSAQHHLQQQQSRQQYYDYYYQQQQQDGRYDAGQQGAPPAYRQQQFHVDERIDMDMGMQSYMQKVQRPDRSNMNHMQYMDYRQVQAPQCKRY